MKTPTITGCKIVARLLDKQFLLLMSCPRHNLFLLKYPRCDRTVLVTRRDGRWTLERSKKP